MDIAIPPGTVIHIAHANGGPPFCGTVEKDPFVITPVIYEQMDHFQVNDVCVRCRLLIEI